MVIYSCEKCGKTFKQKGHYTNHINKKNPCDNIKDKIERNILKQRHIENMLDIKGLNFISEKTLKFERLNSKISRKSLLSNIFSKKLKLERNLDIFSREKSQFINSHRDYIVQSYNRIANQIDTMIPLQKKQLEGLNRILRSLNYKNILKRGYTIIRDESKNIILSKDVAKKQNSLNILFSDGEITVKKNCDD